jgi:hypothetical protein
MLRSIKLQLDSHRLRYMNQHQYGQTNSWFLISSLFWLDTPNTHFNIYLHTSSLINSMQSDFPNLYPYKQTNIETDLYLVWVVSFVIQSLLGISSLMHSWLILQSLIKASPLSNSSCPCKASHYWDQSKIINSCVIYHLPNMLAFSWYYDIPQHRSHFINSICIVIFFLELCYFHDLPTQQYTILALIETSCGISSSLSSCWTYIHLSFHNPQVYAIN